MARVYFLLRHPILQQSTTYSVAKIGHSDRLAGTAARRIRTTVLTLTFRLLHKIYLWYRAQFPRPGDYISSWVKTNTVPS